MMQTKMNHLVHLDLGRHATDEFLKATESFCPALYSISCVESIDLTDEGLMCLGGCEHLRYLDITYCTDVSYEATLDLRKRLRPEADIRRIPEWMDGSYINNQGSTISNWADGSQLICHSNGTFPWIVDNIFKMHDGNPHRVVTRCRLSNSDFPDLPLGASSTWCLLPAGKGKKERNVLVTIAESMHVPAQWPKPEHWFLAVGESEMYIQVGSLLPAGTTLRLCAHYINVTHMRRLELPTSTMPSDSIIQKNQTFCDRFQAEYPGTTPAGRRAMVDERFAFLLPNHG